MDRRYKKRMDAYWLREEQKARRAIESRDLKGGWFDFWHTHPDWKSKGNRYPESRRAVAAITYRLLILTEHLLEERKEPIQVFAAICEDTGSNAIYLHSRNPNGTPFPYDFDGAEWGLEELPGIGPIIDMKTHEIGWEKHKDGSVDFVIRKRA